MNDYDNAKKYFEFAYNSGVPAGAYELGQIFSENENLAIEWYEKFANAGIFPSYFEDKLQHKINTCYYFNDKISFSLECESIVDWYRSRILENYAYMLVKMSDTYIKSENPQNVAKGVKYLKDAANICNSFEAADKLGAFYKKQKNFDMAIYWYTRKSFNSNSYVSSSALVERGKIFCEINDGFKAIKDFEDAYNLGYEEIAFEIAQIYQQGKITPQNAEKAVEWYNKFVRMKDTPYLFREEIGTAFSRIGEIFFNGEGIAVDYEKALEYFLKAVAIFEVTEVCDGYAYYYLGKMYYSGYGVEKNFDKAIAFLKESVAFQNPKAIDLLGAVE